MRFGELVSHTTSRHCTRRAQRPQRTSLCTIRQSTGAAKIKRPFRIDDVAVVYRDLVDGREPNKVFDTRER